MPKTIFEMLDYGKTGCSLAAQGENFGLATTLNEAHQVAGQSGETWHDAIERGERCHY